MKMEIKEHKKNALMKREEVMISVEHGGKATPSRKDLLKEVVSKLKTKEDLVIIDKIFSSKGRTTSQIMALVYKKKEDIPKGKIEKMKNRMEKKKAKPAEEPKPEKPKEGEEAEAKEEAKEEKPAEEAKSEGPAEEARGEAEEEAKPEEKAEEEKKEPEREEKKSE